MSVHVWGCEKLSAFFVPGWFRARRPVFHCPEGRHSLSTCFTCKGRLMVALVPALRIAAGTSFLALIVSGCSEGPATPRVDAAAKPQEVGIVALQPAPLPIVRELPGRMAPTRIAQVRARVSGIAVSRNFEQGSNVQAGDVLYRIDAAPFEIELSAAEATLTKAKAVLEHET